MTACPWSGSSTSGQLTDADPSSTGPGPTTTAAATTGTTTTIITITDSSGATAGSEPTTGSNFLQPIDLGGGLDCTEGDGALLARKRCDVWSQDCGPGDKCTAYSADCDDIVDSNKCVPVDSDPGSPGQPCLVYDGLAGGWDSCQKAAMCRDVDPDTAIGTCVALCAGDSGSPICPPGFACRVTNDGVLNLCLPGCDPLLQDCGDGQLCIPNSGASDVFVCAADLSGEAGQLHDPCEYIDRCDPGLLCADSELAALCDPGFLGCCLPLCDTSMPACPPDLQCLSWYAMNQAPVGLENVGLCRSIP